MSTVPDVPSPDPEFVLVSRPTRFGAWFDRTPWAPFALTAWLAGCIAVHEYTALWWGWSFLGSLLFVGVLLYTSLVRRWEWVPESVARAEWAAAMNDAWSHHRGRR